MHTVLIVEDDPLLLEMYVTKFELEGFQVSSATDGQAGLEAAIRLKPHIMILDNLMPRLSGLELLDKYNRHDPDHHALVIFLSNKSSLSDINRAKELGAHEYLIKSQYTPKDIISRITAKLT